MPPLRIDIAQRLVSERIRRRAALGPLRRLTVSKQTYRRYYEVVDFFLRYCALWNFAVTSEDDLEEHIIWFLSCMWECGGPKSTGNYLVAGIQFFLGRRRRFPEAWRLLATWAKHEMPYRVPPLPPIVLLALADMARCQGLVGLAAILLMGFHGCLRTGEMLGIRRDHILVDNYGLGTLLLPDTKGGKRKGINEMVTITEGRIGRLLAYASSQLLPGDLLFQGSPVQFRQWFASSLAALGIGDMGFQPYSIRRGGATHLLQSGMTMDAILIRGRWEHARTARIYLTEGRAEIIRMSFTPWQQHVLATKSNNLLSVLGNI